MSFRARLIGAVTGVTMVTLGSAFSVVLIADDRSQQRQFDDAVETEARVDALRVAPNVFGHIVLRDRPGPTAGDVGPLIKYEAVYGPGDVLLASTDTFLGAPPPAAVLPHRESGCFDLHFERDHLRGTVAPIPGHPGFRLFLAAPRADLDADAAFLRRAMLTVFGVAVVWATLVASWIVRRLTRVHDAIVAVTHRVAAGDLSARIGGHDGDAETTQLATDIDEMIGRLEALIAGQQRFIAHAAHELRSPLATLYGELSHALRRPRDAAAYKFAIEEALDSSRRLKSLADDLLTLARLGSHEGRSDTVESMEIVSTAAIVAGAVKAADAIAQSRNVAVRVHGDGHMVLGHVRDLERALRNLLENAIWHAPPDTLVEVVSTVRGETTDISVTDEGAGVPPEERDRIFDPFYRGRQEQSRDVPGAGLGLAIARELARAHAGDVYLDTDASVEHGARFVLRLPNA